MADVTSTFGAKDVGFSSTVNRMQKSLAGFQGAITGFAAKAALLVGGFVAARSAVGAFQKAIDVGGQLNDLSARTGETAGNLLVLQRAFQNVGLGAEAVGGTVNRMQRAIAEAASGSKEQAASFQQLGLNFNELKNKTPMEQLQMVAQALERVSNDSDRTKLAMALLGRSGGELIPLFKAMGLQLDEARGQLGSLPGLMDTMVPAFDKIGDNFNAIGEKGMEFAAGLLERLAPALVDVTTKMANIDAAGFGRALSVYVEKTLQWINASLGLTDALNNIQTAIKGIMAGNFGDGLKLMFLTARDTAFAAINQIVAAAKAALSGIGEALQIVFNKDSVTMAYIRGAFSMLGAQIAATMSSQLANVLEAFAKTAPEMLRPLADKMADSFLPGISFMGKQLQGVIDSVDTSSVGAALRGAQAEAETAIKETAEIMAAEAGNLKDEWSLAFASVFKSFRNNYSENMKNPLIEMSDYVKETNDLFEELSARVRAAAFDANEFAGAMERAYIAGEKIDPFKSPFAEKPDDMAENDKGFKFPWQGSGPSGPKIDIPEPAPAPDKKGTKADKPKTALERLRELAGLDPNARAREMIIDRDTRERMNRAKALEGRGAFQSAANEEKRARDRAQKDADKFLGLRSMTDKFFGKDSPLKNMGELEQEWRKTTPFSERFGKNFKDDMTKTEAERKAETDRSAAGGAGGAAAAADPLATIVSFLQSTFGDFKERVPQNALAT